MGTDYAFNELESIMNLTLSRLDGCDNVCEQVEELASCVNSIVEVMNCLVRSSLGDSRIADPNILEENMDTRP